MFDWATYLTLAQELSERGEEACLRSAVSRAYYSALCGARNWLRGRNPALPIPADGSVHEFVWRAFEMGSTQQRQVGQIGRRLRRLRSQADYDDSVPGIKSVAKASVLQATQLTDVLKGLR